MNKNLLVLLAVVFVTSSTLSFSGCCETKCAPKPCCEKVCKPYKTESKPKLKCKKCEICANTLHAG